MHGEALVDCRWVCGWLSKATDAASGDVVHNIDYYVRTAGLCTVISSAGALDMSS